MEEGHPSRSECFVRVGLRPRRSMRPAIDGKQPERPLRRFEPSLETTPVKCVGKPLRWDLCNNRLILLVLEGGVEPPRRVTGGRF